MDNTLSELDDEITVAAFELWLKHARPGQQFEYHRGSLVNDREKVVSLPNHGIVAHVFYEPTHSVALAAWRAYEKGQVVLAQKKIGHERYKYFAFKRGRIVAMRPKRVEGLTL